MSEPLSYEDRRTVMVEALNAMAPNNSSVATLRDLVACQYIPTLDAVKHPALMYDDTSVSYGLVYNFLGHVAVGENHPKRPSFPNIGKHVDVMRNYEYAQSDKRICTKWSTFLNNLVQWKLLPDDFPVDRTAEYIGNNWPVMDGSEFTFEVRDDVKEVYDRESFGSCMYGDPYPRWYNDNSDVVKVVAIFNSGRYCGRALLWVGAEQYDENTGEWTARPYLDRVYPSDGGRHIRAVQQWAEAQGYAHKTDNDMSDERNYDLRVKMGMTEHGYPYMDSLKYAGKRGDTVWLYTDYDRDYDEKLDDTEGAGPGWTGHVECARCECRVPEDDTRTVYISQWSYEEWCEDCRDNAAVWCDGLDEYVAEDEAVRLENGEHAAFWQGIGECEVSGVWAWMDDMVTVEGEQNPRGNSDRLVHVDLTAALANGEWFVLGEAEQLGIVCVDGDWHYMADLLHEVDLDGDDDALVDAAIAALKSGSTFEKFVETLNTEKDVA